MTLDDALPVGENLAKALKLSDPVLEIDLTPNRPDCLSIMGTAREIPIFLALSITPNILQNFIMGMTRRVQSFLPIVLYT